MKITQVELEDGDPARVTVEMTIEEAADLAKIMGGMAPDTGATRATSEVYNCLVGELFNRYWDDGLSEYRSSAS